MGENDHKLSDIPEGKYMILCYLGETTLFKTRTYWRFVFPCQTRDFIKASIACITSRNGKMDTCKNQTKDQKIVSICVLYRGKTRVEFHRLHICVTLPKEMFIIASLFREMCYNAV